MALQDRIRKLTYADYVLLPDDGQRHEIIDGEHYVTAAPFFPHQDLVSELVMRLRSFAKRNGLGTVLAPSCDVLLSSHDIVQPDLVFIAENREAEVLGDPRYIQGAPDLVVEVLSESTRRRDETLKLDLYDRSGVFEYWMFSPIRKTARVYRRTAEGLRLTADLSVAAGENLTTPLLPGLVLPLAEVFG